MAKDQTRIGDQADAVRVQEYVNALVERLHDDRRVLDAYAFCLMVYARRNTVVDARAAISEVLRALVVDELKLPCPRLAELLAVDIGASLLGSPASIVAPDVTRLEPRRPRGRIPGKKLGIVARDVDWFYRAEIAEERESTYSIAKSAGMEGAKAPNHGPVQVAIARCRAALTKFENDAGLV